MVNEIVFLLGFIIVFIWNIFLQRKNSDLIKRLANSENAGIYWASAWKTAIDKTIRLEGEIKNLTKVQ